MIQATKWQVVTAARDLLHRPVSGSVATSTAWDREERPHPVLVLKIRITKCGDQHFVFNSYAVGVCSRSGDDRGKKNRPVAGSQRDAVEREQGAEITRMS